MKIQELLNIGYVGSFKVTECSLTDCFNLELVGRIFERTEDGLIFQIHPKNAIFSGTVVPTPVIPEKFIDKTLTLINEKGEILKEIGTSYGVCLVGAELYKEYLKLSMSENRGKDPEAFYEMEGNLMCNYLYDNSLQIPEGLFDK